ncbi:MULTISPECIES: hypothetical protein [Burkholderia]|uniref:Uncharacterized protein n=1 Tax=Burkholderia sola TaxID=2843302 RepID=A0ABV2CI29_9BURK|nr:hypothetical protein [Burkholderia sp. CpTa8-5]
MRIVAKRRLKSALPILFWVALKQPRLMRCVFRLVCQRGLSWIDELERVVRFVLRARFNPERIMNDPYFIFDRLPEVGRRPRRAARVVTGLPVGLRAARNGTRRFAPTGARVRAVRKPFALRGAPQPAAIGRPKPPRRRIAARGRVVHPVSFFRVMPAVGGAVRDGGRPC